MVALQQVVIAPAPPAAPVPVHMRPVFSQTPVHSDTLAALRSRGYPARLPAVVPEELVPSAAERKTRSKWSISDSPTVNSAMGAALLNVANVPVRA